MLFTSFWGHLRKKDKKVHPEIKGDREIKGGVGGDGICFFCAIEGGVLKTMVFNNP